MECVLQVVLKQATPSLNRELCGGVADTGYCIQIARLEFTIHMQTLTTCTDWCYETTLCTQ